MKTEYQQVLDAVEECKRAVELRDMAIKLYDNKEFNFLIAKGYLEGEAVRLTSLLGDPNDMVDQEAVAAQLRGIAEFRRYLSGIVQFGNIRERELQGHYETLEDLRGEGAEG